VAPTNYLNCNKLARANTKELRKVQDQREESVK